MGLVERISSRPAEVSVLRWWLEFQALVLVLVLELAVAVAALALQLLQERVPEVRRAAGVVVGLVAEAGAVQVQVQEQQMSEAAVVVALAGLVQLAVEQEQEQEQEPRTERAKRVWESGVMVQQP